MDQAGFPIVGIGASAGGLEAFRSFFERMPADSGMAFVLILHLPADRKSLLPEILGRWTSMRVIEATNDTRVMPDCVYVPLPHSLVSFEAGSRQLQVVHIDDNKLFRPIDTFFDSLGAAMGDRAVGIVLSGTGSDGSLGLKAIKERGGLTFAQGSDGTAPQHAGMPAGAIATGAVDVIASVEEIPAHLLRLRGSRLSVLDSPFDSASQVEAARLAICDILRSQLGHDFSGYRDKTFLRRVQRRMQVVGVTTLEQYISRLLTDHEEVVSLFRDLLIRVTSFFRDKETFDVLEADAIPRLFAGKGADNTVRVWVPGCATGEEAYSIAILLREQMDRLVGAPRVQVFATDIDEAAIDAARLGRYPATLLEGLSPERRERFFKPSRGSFVVSKEIRDLCIFSTHNLLRDPPFSRMDLVSCRNLLIYLDTTLQASVIPVLHYALRPGGVLLLGGSESTSKHTDLFDPVDKARRIFRRRDGRSQPLQLSATDLGAAVSRGVTGDSASSFSRFTDSRMPDHHEPRSPLAGPGGAPLSDPNPPDRPGGEHRGTSGALSRFWRRLTPYRKSSKRLESDLYSTQEALQSLAEEHQTALEELRSSNEELHSVNEEMQSTNEELETSKEELQSLNEELHTVNGRLTEKVDELDAANSDLRNLFESTEIAMVFLDRDLVIRSFTPAIAALYNLLPGDHGRPLTDIVSQLEYDSLLPDVEQVLSTLQPLERRVTLNDHSRHYIMRILPYREPDRAVSGALVTFVDVTTIVQAEVALREAELRKDAFIATLSHELRNPLAPIRTAAAMLVTSNLGSEQLGKAQSIIARQVLHLTSLLDDLLDVSRIARSAVVLRKHPVALQTILNDAVETIQPTIDAKHQTLEVARLEERIALEVDPVRLTQVVSNLLNNAAKYTPSGGHITLSCRLDAEWLHLVVRDDGIGLAPEMLQKVFHMFARADVAIDRAEQGLGIGLALVKGLVELHGGKVIARSAGLGKGCEFEASLPRSLVVPYDRIPTTSSTATHPDVLPRVLIADDNEDGAEALQMLLALDGYEVHVANGGEQALALAAKVHPDVCVFDIGMPGMTGYELAKRVRREPWGSQLTLIAVTGWGQERDVRSAREAGFDHHLTKPVDPDRLRALFPPPLSRDEG
ncbi:MAG: CheR family methyltransferase [Gemmatimonadota bacterium]